MAATFPVNIHIDPVTGLLSEARQVMSPNQDARSPAGGIELLVVHNISLPPGQFGGPYIEDLFMNRLDPKAHPYFQEIHQLRVSAHLLIRRDGELVQFVPFRHRAWHSGVSCFQGRDACNDFSIGIELEGTDDLPYSEAQYETLTAVTKALLASYPGLHKDRITGHADIAPGRKTDPGPVCDWTRYLGSLV